jgi:haloalkane dehalogenase
MLNNLVEEQGQGVQFKNFPFQSRYLNLDDGTRIHYIDEGQGIPILFLHGNPTWSFLYRHIINALKPHFRCIAFDYPGFGFSSTPENYNFTAAEHAAVALEVVQKLNLNGFYLMTQDWGGPIGFYVATQLPDRVQGFIIGNTWAWPHRGWRFILFSRLVGGPLGRLAALTFNGVIHLFLQLGVKAGLSREDYAMYLLPFKQRQKRKATHIFPRQLEKAHPFLADLEQSLHRVTGKPALIIWGGKDFGFQEEERQKFEALFKTHQTILLPHAGHFIQEDAPLEISRAIMTWFAEGGV